MKDIAGITAFKYKLLTAVLILVTASIIIISFAPDLFRKDDPAFYDPYLKLLGEVFQAMDSTYYMPVSRSRYDEYVERYKDRILRKLTVTDRVIPMVAWRGAGLLVNTLRDPEDKFTTFIPPQRAEEYRKEIYGIKHDIGITGTLTAEGYYVSHVEKRSDSAKKGLTTGFVITEIDGKNVLGMDEKMITDLLMPELGKTIAIKAMSPIDKKLLDFDIVSEEYFKETIKNLPTGYQGVYDIKIEKFNRETANDLNDLVKELTDKGGVNFMILDIRDNPGGPPLAVREIAGIFLGPNKQLCFYKKKRTALFGLSSPKAEAFYGGPLAVLVNKKSGSASELMAGIFKEYKRAVVIGKEPTAGMSFLKGTQKFEDGSMLVMVTALSYLFNGKELGLKSVTPNFIIPPKVDNQVEFVLNELRK